MGLEKTGLMNEFVKHRKFAGEWRHSQTFLVALRTYTDDDLGEKCAINFFSKDSRRKTLDAFSKFGPQIALRTRGVERTNYGSIFKLKSGEEFIIFFDAPLKDAPIPQFEARLIRNPNQ